MMKKKVFSNKRVIILGAVLLATYLILILTVTNLGQSRLKESQINELHLKVSHYANTLGFIFAVSENDIHDLGEDKTVSTFFANLSSGMSMEYGLGSSLINLQRLLDELLLNSTLDERSIFKRIMLIDIGQSVIADTAKNSYINITSIPFDNMPQTAKIIVVDTPYGLQIKILQAVFYQQKSVALFVAELNMDLIIDQLSIQEHAGSNSRLQLVSNEGLVLPIWDSFTSKNISELQLNRMLTNSIYIERPINGINLKLQSWFEPVYEQEIFTSAWFIIAISLLAIPVVFGLYYLMRIDQSNTRLRTQVEVSSAEKYKLTKQNFLLETEVKKRKRSEDQLAYQATHDSLTGLVNRNYSNNYLLKAIQQSQRNNTQILIMFIDLDNFKQINDTLGHDAGDEILKITSSRLVNTVRQTDVVARLGGDEFLLIIPSLLNCDNATSLASKVLTVFEVPFKVNEHEFYTTTSIGMAIYPQDGKDPQTLLKNADMALYNVKDTGRNGFSFYDAHLNNFLHRSLSLDNRLRLALSNNDIEMYYQPILDLSTRKIVAAEALMRWHDQELGFVSPEEFISLAEKNGLIHQLGEFALRESCQHASQWQSISPIQIAVNFSSVQFRNSYELLHTIKSVLEETHLPAHQLVVEVTESLLINQNKELTRMLNQVDKLGIELSIDDFGTGYSALSYLQKFPFSKLKIDRAFVKNLQNNSADKSLVNAILAMAQALDLKVVAEGIEDDYQADFLTKMKCSYGQGYLFSKAVSAQEFEQLLLANNTNHSK